MTVTDAQEPMVVRGPWFTRVVGPYMCLIAVVGLGVAAFSEPVSAIFVGPLWAAPGFWWGIRISRLAAVASHSGVTIRNPIRTYDIPWSDIRDIRLEKRKSSRWQRLALFFLQFDRRVGVIEVVERADPIEV